MKKARFIVIAAVLLLCVTITVFAVSSYTMTYQPGTTDPSVTNLPDAGTGTGGAAYTVSATIPQRQGYEFIDWTLDYGVETYTVTYVVNPDKTYGVPEDYSTAPTDTTKYAPNDYVTVAPQLTTTVGYAYNEKDEKVKGTWKFESWDKSDFEITEDTTITGGWVFTPAPAVTYSYIVHYRLYDYKTNDIPVHDDKIVEIPSLGINVTEPALDLKKLYAQYRNAKKYRVKPGYTSVTATIDDDGYEIIIYYEEVPK